MFSNFTGGLAIGWMCLCLLILPSCAADLGKVADFPAQQKGFGIMPIDKSCLVSYQQVEKRRSSCLSSGNPEKTAHVNVWFFWVEVVFFILVVVLYLLLRAQVCLINRALSGLDISYYRLK